MFSKPPCLSGIADHESLGTLSPVATHCWFLFASSTDQFKKTAVHAAIRKVTKPIIITGNQVDRNLLTLKWRLKKLRINLPIT